MEFVLFLFFFWVLVSGFLTFPPTRIYRFHGIPITRSSISPRNAPLVAITTTLILSSTPNLEALGPRVTLVRNYVDESYSAGNVGAEFDIGKVTFGDDMNTELEYMGVSFYLRKMIGRQLIEARGIFFFLYFPHVSCMLILPAFFWGVSGRFPGSFQVISPCGFFNLLCVSYNLWGR